MDAFTEQRMILRSTTPTAVHGQVVGVQYGLDDVTDKDGPLSPVLAQKT